jgi:hypothetical protein
MISRRQEQHYNVHVDNEEEKTQVAQVEKSANLGTKDIKHPTGIPAALPPCLILTDSGYKKFFNACKGKISKIMLWGVNGESEDRTIVNPSDFNEAPELNIR